MIGANPNQFLFGGFSSGQLGIWTPNFGEAFLKFKFSKQEEKKYLLVCFPNDITSLLCSFC